MAAGISELNALLGMDVNVQQWEGAMELVEGVKKRLEELVSTATKAEKGVKTPKVPLTDEQEAMNIITRRLKQGRIDALLATTDINKAVSTIGLAGSPGMKGDPGRGVQTAGDKIYTTLKRIAIGFLGVQAVRSFAGMGEHAIEAASKIHDLSISTGISSEALQEMKFAAEQSGSSLEALIAGTKRLNTSLDAAAKTGKGPVVDSLKKLGLTAKGVQKVIKEGGLDAGITLVSEKLAGIKDPAEKSRIAIALLGKSGQSLIPTLTDLAALREDARGLGGIMPEDEINNMEAFGDEMGRVKFAIQGVKDQIVAALIPSLQNVTDGILGWMSANRALIASTAKEFIEGVVSALRALVEVGGVVATIIQLIADHGDIARAALIGLTAAVVVFKIQTLLASLAARATALNMTLATFAAKGFRAALISTGIGALIMLGVAALVLMIEHWDEVKEAAMAVGRAIRDFFVDTIPDALGAAWDAVGRAIKATMDWIADLPIIKQMIAVMSWASKVTGLADAGGGMDSATLANLSGSNEAQLGEPAPFAVSPSAVAGGATSLTIEGGITINSPNADPKQVAAAVKPAMREFLDDELRKAKK